MKTGEAEKEIRDRKEKVINSFLPLHTKRI